MADLAFNCHPMTMRVFRRATGLFEVFRERQLRTVEHHRGKAGVYRQFYLFKCEAVIKMHRHRNGCFFRHVPHHRAQRADIRLVSDDDIIFADSSTTVFYFIKKLLEQHKQFSNLTIVSNSGAIIRELADPPPSITLISMGGVYNSRLNSFLGRIAVNAIKQLHISKAFISAAAVSVSEAYTFHETHAEFLSQVIEHADSTWLLADHLKFETRAVFPICRTADFAGVISDADLPAATIAKYLAAGINIKMGDNSRRFFDYTAKLVYYMRRK